MDATEGHQVGYWGVLRGLVANVFHIFVLIEIYEPKMIHCDILKLKAAVFVCRRLLRSTTVSHCGQAGFFRTAVGIPTSPLDPSVVLANNTIVLFAWQPPESDGGETIQHYRVVLTNEDNELEYCTNSTGWKVPIDQLCSEGCSLKMMVAAVNEVGVGPYSKKVPYAKKAGTDSNLVLSAGLPIIILTTVVLTILLRVYFYQRTRQKRNQQVDVNDNPIILPKDLAKLPHALRKDITITQELGEGHFGKVFEGFVQNLAAPGTKPIKVALKTVFTTAAKSERDLLINEALTMRNFDHENVVKLLGVCIDRGDLWLILEMMDGGDLLRNLKSWRPTMSLGSPASLPDLIRISRDLAYGCEHLTKLGYVHRDLAARNCLLSTGTPSTAIVKISDFGLTRGVYETLHYRLSSESILPIRWTAPEVLQSQIFSSGSDVWSFGVLLWEVFTLGECPYGKLPDTEVIKNVKTKGIMLSCPTHCPKDVFEALQSCWKTNVCERPQFPKLAQQLDSLLETYNFLETISYSAANNEQTNETVFDNFAEQVYVEAFVNPKMGVENRGFDSNSSRNQLMEKLPCLL